MVLLRACRHRWLKPTYPLSYIFSLWKPRNERTVMYIGIRGSNAKYETGMKELKQDLLHNPHCAFYPFIPVSGGGVHNPFWRSHRSLDFFFPSILSWLHKHHIRQCYSYELVWNCWEGKSVPSVFFCRLCLHHVTVLSNMLKSQFFPLNICYMDTCIDPPPPHPCF